MPRKKKQDIEEVQTTGDEGLDKELDNLKKYDEKDLLFRINAEYELGWFYMKPKLDEWALRLKLYNNQKRDKEAVGDPLLFSVHQTVLASLYSDQLQVECEGREEGDAEAAENLNDLFTFDYDEMMKDMIDYEWDWDATFFGRGLLLNMEFDRSLKTPMPEVVDMMTFIRDPRAKSVNGDRKRRGAMKFGGREIRLTKQELRDARIYHNFEDLKPDTSDLRSLMDENVRARMEAQGFNDVTKFQKFTGETADNRFIEWFTYDKGKRVLVTLDAKRTRIIRYTPIKTNYFPIVDRSIYPISHDWDGVSIPDLVEDKQRGRAVVQNLALKGIKIGLHPTYLYDTNKIKNRANLNVDFNKHIGVDGNPTGALVPVQRDAVKQEADWILNVLDQGAQKATATPDIQQGVQAEQKRTATELNLVASKVDTRYSLSAKIFGWSEKEFWKQCYDLYKTHFISGIDEKTVRISGAMGSKWRKLTRENIIAHTDPDIKIESRIISEAKKFNELQKYRLFLKDVQALAPESSNIRFALRKIGRLSGFRKDEVDLVLPPTIDELNAGDENNALNAKKLVPVQVYDDDFVHMEVHNRAADTPQKYAHMEAHKKALMLKRMKPEFNYARNAEQQPVGEAVQNPSFVTAGSQSTGGAPTMRQLPQLNV